MCFEVIAFEEIYSCATGLIEKKTRSNRAQFEGFITKPVFKKQILKQVQEIQERIRGRKRERNQCHNIVIGQIPEPLVGVKKDVRLVFIQKKRVCEIVEFQPICGSLIDYTADNIPYKFDVTPDSSFSPSLKAQIFRIKVPFDKNSTSFNKSLLRPLFDTLSSQNTIVKKATITAYASVEGDLEGNKALYEQRAQRILKAIEKEQHDSIPRTVVAEENWKDFFTDIKGTDYEELWLKDTNSIKAYVNEHSAEMEDILKNHRYTAVNLVLYPRLDWKTKMEYTLDEYNAWLYKLEKQKGISKVRKRRMLRVQNYIFWRSLVDSSDYTQHMYLPKAKWLVDFNYRQTLFDFLYIDDEPVAFYEKLKELKKLLPKYDELEFNALVHHVNFKDHDYMGELFNKGQVNALINHKLLPEDSIKEDLKVLFHFENTNDLFMKYGGRKLNRAKSSLKFLHDHFLRQELSEEMRIAMARFYISFFKFEWANEMLEPIIHDSQRAMVLFLKVNAFLDVLDQNEAHVEFLLKARKELGDKKWCNLFLGPCNINFQIFRNGDVLGDYCEYCR